MPGKTQRDKAVAPDYRMQWAATMLTIASLALALCVPNRPAQPGDEKTIPGMNEIHSSGKSFPQGANDSNASVSDWEKPAMQTVFTYNYWIDTVEVTQKQYYAIMGKHSIPDSVRSGRGDDYPAAFVTWYDAILFCNAKSLRYGLDTVYSYFEKDTTASGAVINMIGLIIHYDRNGVRLPTEAEWEYAAREGASTIPFPHLPDSGGAKTYAWFDLNSAGAAHPVATLLPNRFGLYDMAGNAFEWTADWKGPHAPVSVTNSIGAPGPDGYFEKALKGGSFKHSFFYLRPSRRSGTYQTSLSTMADFIGFRCARGKIPAPYYYTADSNVIAVNPFALTSGAVAQWIGTSNVKLAFVNVSSAIRTLCIVDFNQSIPSVRQFTDMTSVYVPTISPDGKFVAFCNRGEGLGGAATVFIRPIDGAGAAPLKLSADSAYVPRWWIDRTALDTFLVYTNSTIDDKSGAWSSTKTFLQKMSGGKPLGDPEVLVNDGSFHDGLSSNRQFMVTGYTQCFMRDIFYNNQRQLFLSPYNGKDPSGSTQVCNVSISPDPAHPDRCLFLDFGSSNQVSTLTQTIYGIHEYLFIAEFSGSTVAWYKCPGAETCWDYPEWSNNSRFAAACCRNARGDAHAVYCVNLNDTSSLQLVEGTELNHPYLWIGSSPDSNLCGGLSSDSLGVYNDPFLSGNQIPFSFKMKKFWKMHRSLNVIFVGSSQVLCGIDCAKLPEYSSVNLGYAAAGVTTCAGIIRDYILPACSNVRCIGMSSAVYWLGNPGGEGDDTWQSSITQTKGYLYDTRHNFWRDGFPAHFDDCIAAAPYFADTHCDTLGMSTDTCGNWGGDSPDLGGGSNWDWPITDTNYTNNFNAIVALIEDLAKRNIHLLMINFPESPAYKKTNHYTRGGPSWATGVAVVMQLESLQSTYPNFHFYDAYNNGNHDYTDADAQNWNHLCPTGAAKLSSRVDSLVRVILSK